DLIAVHGLGDDADNFPAATMHRPRGLAHQADAASAVDQVPSLAGDPCAHVGPDVEKTLFDAGAGAAENTDGTGGSHDEWEDERSRGRLAMRVGIRNIKSGTRGGRFVLMNVRCGG